MESPQRGGRSCLETRCETSLHREGVEEFPVRSPKWRLLQTEESQGDDKDSNQHIRAHSPKNGIFYWYFFKCRNRVETIRVD